MKTKGLATPAVVAIIVIVIAIAGIGIYLVKRDEIPSGKSKTLDGRWILRGIQN